MALSSRASRPASQLSATFSHFPVLKLNDNVPSRTF
jgi:hypothetical protein